MIHYKQDGSNDSVIFLLHGTGGNERDLIPIGQFIDNNATYIGIRGNVDENGMLRYFKRNLDGSFDHRSLAKETYVLWNEIQVLIEKYDLNDKKLTILGYSNGANILINMMKEFKLPFDGYYLHHPSTVRPEVPFKHQAGYVFVTSGKMDPYLFEDQYNALVDSLQSTGMDTITFQHEMGHALTNDELVDAKQTFEKKATY